MGRGFKEHGPGVLWDCFGGRRFKVPAATNDGEEGEALHCNIIHYVLPEGQAFVFSKLSIMKGNVSQCACILNTLYHVQV